VLGVHLLEDLILEGEEGLEHVVAGGDSHGLQGDRDLIVWAPRVLLLNAVVEIHLQADIFEELEGVLSDLDVLGRVVSIVGQVLEPHDLHVFQQEIVSIVEHHRVVDKLVVEAGVEVNQLAVDCDISHVKHEELVPLHGVVALWDEKDGGVKLDV
jgi:hypothetical protein